VTTCSWQTAAAHRPAADFLVDFVVAEAAEVSRLARRREKAGGQVGADFGERRVVRGGLGFERLNGGGQLRRSGHASVLAGLKLAGHRVPRHRPGGEQLELLLAV
jgi:hypothetical protein